MYNNILISLSESSKNFRLSLEFTSGESFTSLQHLILDTRGF